MNKKFNVLYTASKNNVFISKDYEYVNAKISELVSQDNISKNRANGFLYLGWIYSAQKKLNESVSYYFKALEIAEADKNLELIAKINDRLGNAYKDLNNTAFAKKHFNYALQAYGSAGLEEDKSEMFNVLGTLYKNENIIDSALFYHKKALEIRLKLKNKKLLASTYNNLGLVYKKNKDYDLALNYLKLALAIRKEANDKKGIAGASINIGNVLNAQKKPKEALEFIKEGTTLAYEIKAGDFYKNGIEAFSDAYYSLGDYKAAADYLSRAKKIIDSLEVEQVNKQISELSAQYESNKKDAELTLQEEKLKSQTSEIKRQKAFIISVGVVLALVILLIFFVYRSYRINKKNAVRLSRQNIIIEQKNKEIVDSINYARRIQNSILPSDGIIQKHLTDFFVLYKPKDIVSGDFYWISSQKNNSLLIAVADCTGHGVPGAFMSLIGKEKLDKAITESDSPARILSYLNNEVKASLQKESNEQAQDGMDIALIKLQPTANGAIVNYAGANRPLWVIKNNAQEIEETKATKSAIAGFTGVNHVFEEHQLNLNKGDTIYMFTDGYADQFGGENAKKLTSKSFKKLLLSQHTKSMREQKNYYTTFIENWMKDQEQVDDILVIGIRV